VADWGLEAARVAGGWDWAEAAGSGWAAVVDVGWVAGADWD